MQGGKTTVIREHYALISGTIGVKGTSRQKERMKKGRVRVTPSNDCGGYSRHHQLVPHTGRYLILIHVRVSTDIRFSRVVYSPRCSHLVQNGFPFKMRRFLACQYTCCLSNTLQPLCPRVLSVCLWSGVRLGLALRLATPQLYQPGYMTNG